MRLLKYTTILLMALAFILSPAEDSFAKKKKKRKNKNNTEMTIVTGISTLSESNDSEAKKKKKKNKLKKKWRKKGRKGKGHKFFGKRSYEDRVERWKKKDEKRAKRREKRDEKRAKRLEKKFEKQYAKAEKKGKLDKFWEKWTKKQAKIDKKSYGKGYKRLTKDYKRMCKRNDVHIRNDSHQAIEQSEENEDPDEVVETFIAEREDERDENYKTCQEDLNEMEEDFAELMEARHEDIEGGREPASHEDYESIATLTPAGHFSIYDTIQYEQYMNSRSVSVDAAQ